MSKTDANKSEGMITAIENNAYAPWLLTSSSNYGNIKFSGVMQTYGLTEYPADSKVYGQRPYTLDITDNTLFMSSPSGSVPLEKGDYQFTKIMLSGFYQYRLTDPANYSSWVSGDYKPEDYGPTGVYFQTEIGGKWKLLGNITRFGTSPANMRFTYDPAYGSGTIDKPTTSYLSFLTIPLPAGTVGFKLSIPCDANTYQTIFNESYTQVELLRSDKVLGLIEDAANRFITNTMYVDRTSHKKTWFTDCYPRDYPIRRYLLHIQRPRRPGA